MADKSTAYLQWSGLQFHSQKVNGTHALAQQHANYLGSSELNFKDKRYNYVGRKSYQNCPPPAPPYNNFRPACIILLHTSSPCPAPAISSSRWQLLVTADVPSWFCSSCSCCGWSPMCVWKAAAACSCWYCRWMPLGGATWSPARTHRHRHGTAAGQSRDGQRRARRVDDIFCCSLHPQASVSEAFDEAYEYCSSSGKNTAQAPTVRVLTTLAHPQLVKPIPLAPEYFGHECSLPLLDVPINLPSYSSDRLSEVSHPSSYLPQSSLLLRQALFLPISVPSSSFHHSSSRPFSLIPSQSSPP